MSASAVTPFKEFELKLANTAESRCQQAKKT